MCLYLGLHNHIIIYIPKSNVVKQVAQSPSFKKGTWLKWLKWWPFLPASRDLLSMSATTWFKKKKIRAKMMKKKMQQRAELQQLVAQNSRQPSAVLCSMFIISLVTQEIAPFSFFCAQPLHRSPQVTIRHRRRVTSCDIVWPSHWPWISLRIRFSGRPGAASAARHLTKTERIKKKMVKKQDFFKSISSRVS